MKERRFKVFGKVIAVTGQAGSWQAYYPGSNGTRSPTDFIIPAEVEEDDLADYLADLFHEDATPRRNMVERLPDQR